MPIITQREIPAVIDFQLFSGLTDEQKNNKLRLFLNQFAKEFNEFQVSLEKDWKRRLESAFYDVWYSRSEDTIFSRNTLITRLDREEVAAQRFYINEATGDSYGEGIFVIPGARGNGIAAMTREVLYAYLVSQGIYVFKCVIDKNKLAQGLASKTVKYASQAVVDLKTTPKKRFILSYGINLEKYPFVYSNAREIAERLE